MKTLALALTSLCLLTVASAAMAQQLPPGWTADAGAAVIFAPAFSGSDDYQLSAVPDVNVKYEDKFFAGTRDGIGYNVINQNGLRAGPIARYDGGRDDDGKRFLRVAGDRSRDLEGLGEVDGAPEVGGFVSYDILPQITAEAEVRQAIGGHEGLVGDLGANYHTEVGGFAVPVYFSAGPRMKIASSDYNEAYYGIDAGQSANSGLAQYNPDGGIVSYGVGAAVVVPVSQKVRTTLFAGYDRLGDEPGDSPLVEDRGSRNQGSVGVSAAYAF